ncbi:Txe/YoeB family addiction module toxin [Desulfolutivibrio sulfoxidireducens]|uniref:Txe/YoeB family addiction module toxin n=1 Tax=Desulfolutivibrio sulfoxidireducens TaxID=2773299 RepID=UPI00159D81FF|nr:Txe/YoeB family addiction module toxin [Desulfolutivibrio sulfoxidireducens]QLA15263.1 Txe/YoeB family addiction module toxin [Desulfolutivibrio sulfoxidireducens]
MRLVWTPQAWEDYLFWQATDRSKVKQINELIRETLRSPFEGKGKPEALRFDLSGYWSRRITAEHRLIYGVSGDDLVIVACRYHYS